MDLGPDTGRRMETAPNTEMKLRYKTTGAECASYRFNTHALGEVLTGDDSAYIKDLDVWLPALNTWKDLREAFRDRDVIPDNRNEIFGEPSTPEERERGYF